VLLKFIYFERDLMNHNKHHAECVFILIVLIVLLTFLFVLFLGSKIENCLLKPGNKNVFLDIFSFKNTIKQPCGCKSAA